MVNENRKNRSIAGVIAIILATSALILAGFNTFTLIFQPTSGTTSESQKSLVRVYINDTYITDTNDEVRLNFTTKTFDINSDFDLGDDAFISSNEGYYRFHLHLEYQSSSPLILLYMFKDGEIYSHCFYDLEDSVISFSDIIYLNLGARVNYTLRFNGNIGAVVGDSNGERTHLTVEEL